jgi:Rrf2 family cysteine metabolism transcriptional repressor
MKKMTTKGHYGTRLMVHLARQYARNTEPISIKTIARDEKLSLQYLQQMTIPLKHHHLIKSSSGAHGGHVLARKPSEIRILEILSALEGSCALAECVDDASACSRREACVLLDVWKGATDLLEDYFGRVTLQDVLDIADKKAARIRKKSGTR